ncbi:hypothetical protein MWU57_01255 [Isoptericola sp. S6320L]|uniref:hypothetical protein n=1 Tax=Isoptericola sp. S6320L TaxID=2926411 RepID=UPI001FF5FF49|nr:hypothetical protein [Isoptericola sp. S6320L]MCK0115646.1 hypothetical protein [Isoptericola sp. S6320L]
MALVVALMFVGTDAGAVEPTAEATDKPWAESAATVGESLTDAADQALEVVPDVAEDNRDAPGVDADAEEWDESPEPPECANEAATAADAFWMAASCGRDVLILDELSPWDTVYATPQGRLVRETTVVAERTNIDGEWSPVDPRLEVESGGAFRVASPVVEMELAGSMEPGGVLASLTTDDGEVGLSVSVGLGDPSVEENRATYPVLDEGGARIAGAQLVVRVAPDATGLTPVLVLDSAEAAEAVLAATESSGLSFEISAGQGLELVEPKTDESGVRIVPEGGDTEVPVLQVLPAYQWDSAGGDPVFVRRIRNDATSAVLESRANR